MVSKKFLGTLAIAVALTSPALAQDNQPFPPPKTEDPGNWRPGDATKPPVLQPTEPTPPAQPTPPAPAPADPGLAPAPAQPTAPAPKELTPEEKAKRDRAIQRNYDAAEKILRGTLNDKNGQYKVVNTRVNSIKSLIQRYERRQAAAIERRRNLQVELFNKSLYYQRQKEAGRIPPKLYEEKLKEENDRYLQEKKALDSELQFLGDELKRLRAKLNEQEASKQAFIVQNPEVIRKMNAKKNKPSAAAAITKMLDKKTRELSAFGIKGSLGNSRLNGHP